MQKRSVLLSSLIPRPVPFLVARRTWEGHGIFPHMCDIKGRKVVERTILNVVELELRTAREKLRHLVTYLTLCS